MKLKANCIYGFLSQLAGLTYWRRYEKPLRDQNAEAMRRCVEGCVVELKDLSTERIHYGGDDNEDHVTRENDVVAKTESDPDMLTSNGIDTNYQTLIYHEY